MHLFLMRCTQLCRPRALGSMGSPFECQACLSTAVQIAEHSQKILLPGVRDLKNAAVTTDINSREPKVPVM